MVRPAPALPPAILFDLDDTIIAAGDRAALLLEVASELADSLAPHAPAAVADRLDAALTWFWSDPVRHRQARFAIGAARVGVVGDVLAGPDGLGLSVEVAHRFAERFTELRGLATDFYPGSRETLETLKAYGVRLALVTNGAAQVQRAKIERFSLSPLFEHIQIEGEHGFGKPEEQAYLHALAALGVGPGDAWMVGDNLEWEVAAPQRLGIYAIWHDPRGKGLPAGSPVRPDRIIRRLSELLE